MFFSVLTKMHVKILIVLTLFLFCRFSTAQSITSEQKVKKDIKVISTDIVNVKFGSDPDDIGIITPKEANPEGPMSFALGDKGEIYILDQVNSRIQCFREKYMPKYL